MILPEIQNEDKREIYYVVGYDFILEQLVYVPDERNRDSLEVSVPDLKKKKEWLLVFENKCGMLPEGECIVSIHFNVEKIELFATLTDIKDPSGIRQISGKKTVIII